MEQKKVNDEKKKVEQKIAYEKEQADKEAQQTAAKAKYDGAFKDGERAKT